MAGTAGSNNSLGYTEQTNCESKDLRANQEILYYNVQYYIHEYMHPYIQLLLDVCQVTLTKRHRNPYRLSTLDLTPRLPE